MALTNKIESAASIGSIYSERGIENIYALARFHIENGNLKGAEQIARGLTEFAPQFAPGWLLLSYVQIMENNIEVALVNADIAFNASPQLKQAILFQITCHLSLRDLSTAGTLLGEYGELVEGGQVSDPNHIRFYRMQLGRFQALR